MQHMNVKFRGLRHRFDIQPSLKLLIVILVLVTVARLIGLVLSEVELFMDEAQYWSWSRDAAWGYYSKPPLLAWIIKIAELVCGSGEACIRAPSPIFYFGTCILVYLTALNLYGRVVAFWAALLTVSGTGLIFSSRIISTDVPLAFFWALALLAYVKLLEGVNWQRATMLGLALGLGFLAKYAMIYFLLGMLLGAGLDRRANLLLRNYLVWLALVIAAIVVTPNLVWVAQHNWVTIQDVSRAIQTDKGFQLNPLWAIEFLAAQFAVFGPVVFATLIFGLIKPGSSEKAPADKLMLAFAIPPLACITAVAMFTRVYGNWAAPAVVPGTILAAAILVQHKAWLCLALSAALGVTAQTTLLVGDAMASRVTVPFLPPGRADVYNRTLGSRALADQVSNLAARAATRRVAGEERRTIAALLYYGRLSGLQVLTWPSADSKPFDLGEPISGAASPILFVTECPSVKRLSPYYASVERIGEIKAPTGPTSNRHLAAFRLSEPKEVPGRLPKCGRE